MKTIEELCGQVSATHEVRGDARVQVRGITADSRDVQPGDLFVCVAGAHVDGKTFADGAVALAGRDRANYRTGHSCGRRGNGTVFL